MSDKSVRAQIYENSLMFIKRQINAVNFVKNIDELFENENFKGIDATLFNDINDLATLASLYVKDPEIRKEEVSYIDEGADIDNLEVIICLPISAGPSRDCLSACN